MVFFIRHKYQRLSNATHNEQMLNYIVLLILIVKLTFGLSHSQILVCTHHPVYIPKLSKLLRLEN